MKARTLVLLVVLVGGGGAGLWWWLSRGKTEAPPPRQYAEATRGDIVVEVTATGTVEPEFIVEIKSKASGTVKSVPVEVGSHVEKNDILVEIDPLMENRKLVQAHAELRMAQAQRGNVASKLEYTRAKLARDEALQKKGLVAPDALDELRKELAVLKGEIQVAEAQLLRARAAHAEAKDRLAETSIRAPISGTVLERTVNPGTVVTAGTTTGGQTLLMLADLARLFVKVKVDEADVAKIAPGQSARVTSDALPGVVFLGKVLRVAPQGKVESSVTTFDVVVELTGKGKQKLRPMLTANVYIKTGEAKGAVLLPRQAVQQRSGRAVVIVDGKGPQRVKIGLADDQSVQILSGIEPGTKVLVPGARTAGRPEARQKAGTVPGMGGMGRRGGRL